MIYEGKKKKGFKRGKKRGSLRRKKRGDLRWIKRGNLKEENKRIYEGKKEGI